ncbi:hypothetical protein JCM19231_1027 [Vibrio ishigakensis]|uniref:Uncharacterized protein n=1 Tax=Vibrio ishigakensis TaxID=1481914 RepID=A0A0B8NP53_9VIBR|nr:hypothetical protein JCM19231_1027 [Vibrio ishigakensis]
MALANQGRCHSVEVWQEDELIGGSMGLKWGQCSVASLWCH